MGAKEGWNVYIPHFEYCTDNAAMIAIAGYHKFLKSRFYKSRRYASRSNARLIKPAAYTSH